ncbi:SART3 [Lepeophtheirus salmonis]|uniref:Pre-rRNA-processing protein TSR2 homolog n=1 Tax=Lepeophtheirus salmonis TaxID=72036 RepID=A0A7R8CJJ8_LEPSM|nr:SART3 [Lepeophtheirus salmonis]CAF2812036.1 SART3 [Lepeophtheirus salmonis]
MSSTERSYFLTAIEAILSNWTALQLAISQNAAGSNSIAVGTWMSGAIVSWFEENKNVEYYEATELLETILNQEFNLIVQDGSADEIGRLIYSNLCPNVTSQSVKIEDPDSSNPMFEEGNDDAMECESKMDQDGDLVNDEQDNDSLDDEDMEDAREKELNEKLKAVNETLKNNPYDYQSHIDKISVLKSLGELEELRLARQTFSKLYPLSVELWLTWLQDEQRLASSPKERKEVCHLFKRAVQDYLSVDIWIEYCSFILGDVGSADGVSSAREVFEEAVAAIGLHVGKGYLIWGAYRDFEVAVMNLHNKGYEFVFKVFQRQLAIPLLNMEKSIEELKDFEDIPDFKRFSSSSSLSSVYQNSLKKLQGKEEFENALLQTVGDSEANFIKYSEYIQALRDNKSSSPPEIQNLYERRITDHCLNPISWIEYLNYLDSVLKIQSIAIALEVYGSDLKEITKVFEEALASGFSDPVDYSRIWINYISYFRRKIDDDGIPNSDPELKLSRFWASVSGDRLRDMETARKCWAKIVHLIGDRMIYWTEGMEKIKDFPDYFAHLWRQFELEEGDLTQLQNAEDKIRKCLLINEERLAKKDGSDTGV